MRFGGRILLWWHKGRVIAFNVAPLSHFTSDLLRKRTAENIFKKCVQEKSSFGTMNCNLGSSSISWFSLVPVNSILLSWLDLLFSLSRKRSKSNGDLCPQGKVLKASAKRGTRPFSRFQIENMYFDVLAVASIFSAHKNSIWVLVHSMDFSEEHKGFRCWGKTLFWRKSYLLRVSDFRQTNSWYSGLAPNLALDLGNGIFVWKVHFLSGKTATIQCLISSEIWSQI